MGNKTRSRASDLEQLRFTSELLQNVDDIPPELVDLLQQLHNKVLERTYKAARLEWLRRTRRQQKSQQPDQPRNKKHR